MSIAYSRVIFVFIQFNSISIYGEYSYVARLTTFFCIYVVSVLRLFYYLIWSSLIGIHHWNFFISIAAMMLVNMPCTAVEVSKEHFPKVTGKRGHLDQR